MERSLDAFHQHDLLSNCLWMIRVIFLTESSDLLSSNLQKANLGGLVLNFLGQCGGEQERQALRTFQVSTFWTLGLLRARDPQNGILKLVFDTLQVHF